ncbi:MAG: LapA family protein [bacterium]
MTKLVLALFCALLVAIFAVQNAGTVVVGFLHRRFEVSLALVILGSTVLGAVFVFLLGIVQQISRGRRIKEYRNRIKELEVQLEASAKKEDLPTTALAKENGLREEEDASPQYGQEEAINRPTEGSGC